MTIAYAYASGNVGFGEHAPKGALSIGTVKTSKLDSFKAHCRLAYDNETLLVPGVPEAEDQTAGVDALLKFRDRLISLQIVEA